MERRLAAIVFTDIAGFTALSQEDEARAIQLLQEQERLIRPLLRAHHGRKVKSMGDGLLLEFPDALDAVEFGIQLQERVHGAKAATGGEPPRIRVGIHLGDVQRQGRDILGDAVNVASRVEPIAEPEGVCLSSPVYDQVRNKVSAELQALGPRVLKGVREPVGIFRVVFPWSGALAYPPEPTLPRIAVLPLTNISPDPNDEYLAEGLTEEITSVLSHIAGLRVIARTSVNQYRGTTKPVTQIGLELGVGSVLEGSVRKAGDRIRITVQLVDAKSQTHRWSQTYDRQLESIFSVQSDVATQVAQTLQVELLRSEIAAVQARPTSNMAAYEAYLRGIQAYRRLGGEDTESADLEADRYFSRAIQEDTEFAAAYGYLASHLVAVMGETRSRAEVLPRVRPLVRRALELNPSSSEAFVAQANLDFQVALDWKAAETGFQQAIVLNPSNSPAHAHLGFLLGVLQRFEEEKQQLLTAIELDPLWLVPRMHLVSAHGETGDYATAISLLEGLKERFGPIPQARLSVPWYYVYEGRPEMARSWVEGWAALDDPAIRECRNGILAFLGDVAAVRRLETEVAEGLRTQQLPPWRAAFRYAVCGKWEKALALLEQDMQSGERMLWITYQHPAFDPLRSDPRFTSLLKELNLPTSLKRPLIARMQS